MDQDLSAGILREDALDPAFLIKQQVSAGRLRIDGDIKALPLDRLEHGIFDKSAAPAGSDGIIAAVEIVYDTIGKIQKSRPVDRSVRIRTPEIHQMIHRPAVPDGA